MAESVSLCYKYPVQMCLDSYSHYELAGLQLSASIPPICDIPVKEVNRELYGRQYPACSSEASG